MTPEEALALADEFPDADPPAPPIKESIARGAGQGLTLGFLDEGAAALAATVPALDREAAQGDSWKERYRAARALYRQLNREAQRAHPTGYAGGEFGGAMAGTVAAPVRSLVGATGLGAASGAGHSEGDAAGIARDAATGGALSLGLGAAGAAVGAVGRRLTDRGLRKAVAEAESAVGERIDSARGAYGSVRQQESRFIENLLRAEATGTLTPANAAKLAALKASPRWSEAVNQLAANTMEDLPTTMADQVAKKAAYEALAQGSEQGVRDEAFRLLSGREARRLAVERMRRYGWPLLIGGAAGSAFGPVGVAGGGLAGLATRPTLRALGHLLTKPSWLVREGNALEGIGGVISGPVTPRTVYGLHLTERGAPDGGDALTYEDAMRILDSFPDAG